MTIKNIFDEIAAEGGTNKKMEILAKYKDDELLRRVLYLANSKRIKFYIKQIPEYTKSTTTATLSESIDMLSMLSTRTLTGHDAVAHLSRILSYSTPDDAYIIKRIIDKDCRIGMGTTNMNKIFPKLIEDTPYMGAKAYDEKLAKNVFKDGPAYSQVKMDGRYANAIICDGDVELESRGGEPTRLKLAKFFRELKGFENCVLNGELTIDGVPRYKSNGIIASLVSIGTKEYDGADVSTEIEEFEKEHGDYDKALDSIRFTVWDMITVKEYLDTKSATPYSRRLYDVQEAIKDAESTMVSMIKTVTVKTYEEAMVHFQEALKAGEEGTILKSNKGVWKDGKPNWQVKMKLEMDVDLKIVGFNYGTGKNESVISSVDAQSSDGLVFTSPTGINEKMMKFITENQEKLMGSILEVKCSGLTHDSKGKFALLHPVFKNLREDKNTCDTLESIKEIEAMAKGLK